MHISQEETTPHRQQSRTATCKVIKDVTRSTSSEKAAPGEPPFDMPGLEACEFKLSRRCLRLLSEIRFRLPNA